MTSVAHAFRRLRTLAAGSACLAGHNAILPVLRAQLQEVAESIERSVGSVCQNFQGMAGRARQAVKDAPGVLNGDGQNGLDALIATSRSTLEKLLARIERSSDSSLHAARQVEDVDSAMKKILNASIEIENIAFTNRILALNAKIQAVQVGEAGAAFSVVAEEISAQATRSTDLATAIEENVKLLSRAISGVARDLRCMAAEERELRDSSRQEIERLLDGFSRAHADTQEWVDRAARESSEVAREIADAIVALQFQDRVGQRIGHVIAAISDIERAIDVTGDHHASAQADALVRMEQTYTMEDERAVLAAAAGRTVAPSNTEPEGSDVELF